MKKETIGIIIPTLNAEKQLPALLASLKNTTSPILVIDSSSDDATVAVAKEHGAEVLKIAREAFNHGATRELARKHLNTDIVVMLTSDVVLADHQALELLVAPLINKQAEVSYGRQLPYPDAGFFEAFSRFYNYPDKSHIRSIKEKDQYGVYTFFCSDSFAAYRSTALDEVGGFPTVLLGEDTLIVASMLNKGYRIAYIAEAQVYHSHNYSLVKEFQRYFDTGIMRREFKEIFRSAGSDESRGKAYLKEMFSQLKSRPHLLPYALFHVTARWCGYKIGARSLNAPIWLKRKLSSQPYYWESKSYHQKAKQKLQK